jgi:hypothetical protein
MHSPLPSRSEWVELVNPGPLPWNLGGWSLCDGNGIMDSTRRFALPNVTVEPQAFAVLAADSSIFFDHIPSSVPVIVWNTFPISLNNSGDSLALFSVDGQLMDRVDYRASWGDGAAGRSIERISLAASSNDPLNWASSLDSSGATPGRANSRAHPEGQRGSGLLSLEPNPFSPDGDGRHDMLAVRYRLEQADSRLDLKIYDVRGRLIRHLANNEPAGYSGEKLWDGKDDNGRTMPTGLYIVYLEALGKSGTRIQSARRPVALARRS